MLKTFNEIKGQVFDISGIDNPNDYLFDNRCNMLGVYYPTVRKESIEFKKGETYDINDIENFSIENNYKFNQLGGNNWFSGKIFITLENPENRYIISFILNKDYVFECIYNDFE